MLVVPVGTAAAELQDGWRSLFLARAKSADAVFVVFVTHCESRVHETVATGGSGELVGTTVVYCMSSPWHRLQIAAHCHVQTGT